MPTSNPTAQQPPKSKLTVADFTCRAETFHAIRGSHDYGTFLTALGAMFDLSNLPIGLLVDLHAKKTLGTVPLTERTYHIFSSLNEYLNEPRDVDDLEITAYFIAPYLHEFTASFQAVLEKIASGRSERPGAQEYPGFLVYQTLYVLMRAGLEFSRLQLQRLTELVQYNCRMPPPLAAPNDRSSAPESTPPTAGATDAKQ